MAEPLIVWRGLTLGADGSDIDVETVTGWDELPEVTDMSLPRTRGHGEHVGDLYAQPRVVTMSGRVSSRAARDELAAAIGAAGALSSAAEDLTVTSFGVTLTAGARLNRRALSVEADYASGSAPLILQWRCPDPLRYGPIRTATTGLPTPSGGLIYPLTYPLDYGLAGAAGQLTLDNPGTADTPIVLDVTGGLPGGFDISAAGRRITYPTAVPAGQTVTIDTATGTVVVEGTADRRGELTSADWLTVPAGSALTVQFVSLGGAYDPAAQLTARWAEAHW